MLENYKKNRAAGFTLLEILVALALIGLTLGLVVASLDDAFDKRIKTATNKMSATVRYLHDKASTQNLYIRMIFDFEKNSYWVEATSEQFLLATKEIQEAEAEELEEAAGQKEEEETIVDEETGEETTVTLTPKYRTPEFGAVDDFLLKPTKLPDGVLLKDVYTSHDEGPVTGGQAYIYFFPNGYIEPSVINLMDEDDEANYSVMINPIIGSTSIANEYKTLEGMGEEK